MGKRYPCKQTNCKKLSVRKGLCYGHFREAYPEDYKHLLAHRSSIEKCKIENCDNQIQRKGLCKTHLKDAYPEVLLERQQFYNKWRYEQYHTNEEFRKKHLKRKHEQYLRNVESWRNKVLHYYSNGTMKCLCCGFDNPLGLTIDHINKRTADDVWTGYKFYAWLIRKHLPEGYRTWCYNCNCSRGRMKLDYCPLHQTSQEKFEEQWRKVMNGTNLF